MIWNQRAALKERERQMEVEGAAKELLSAAMEPSLEGVEVVKVQLQVAEGARQEELGLAILEEWIGTPEQGEVVGEGRQEKLVQRHCVQLFQREMANW